MSSLHEQCLRFISNIAAVLQQNNKKSWRPPGPTPPQGASMSFSKPLSLNPLAACMLALTVQGTNLTLNGAGTRYKAIFKVYDLALYTPRKVSTPEELLALPGPKRLSFVALREIPGTDLGVAFIKGLQANASKEQVQKHTGSSTRLIDIF